MPKLWTQTIDAHRRAVRETVLDTTAALVTEHGLASVTMSKIAEETGIGRATLYKYFPDVNAILTAWHERHITSHLDQLADVARRADGGPARRLEAVLETYALIQHQMHKHHGGELIALLHRGKHVARARRRLHEFISALLTEAAQAGDVRDDVAADELASYCLHALTAASTLPSRAAVGRLVAVTITGLRRDQRCGSDQPVRACG